MDYSIRSVTGGIIVRDVYTNPYEMNFNKNVADGISVNRVILYEEKIIHCFVDKKIKKEFKSLLELIASICEGDENPDTGLMFALSEADRLKRIMLNKYQSYLDKKEEELLLKKFDVIKKEINKKLEEYLNMRRQVADVIYMNDYHNIGYQDVYEFEAEHHRSR